MPELELALFTVSIAMNASLWYKLGKLEKDLGAIKSNMITHSEWKK